MMSGTRAYVLPSLMAVLGVVVLVAVIGFACLSADMARASAKMDSATEQVGDLGAAHDAMMESRPMPDDERAMVESWEDAAAMVTEG